MNQGEQFSRHFDRDSLLYTLLIKIYFFLLLKVLLSFISFFQRETFSTGVEKLEKLELVKFDEIKKNNLKVFHFKMQVDIQLSCASVLAYFNERLALAMIYLQLTVYNPVFLGGETPVFSDQAVRTSR